MPAYARARRARARRAGPVLVVGLVGVSSAGPEHVHVRGLVLVDSYASRARAGRRDAIIIRTRTAPA